MAILNAGSTITITIDAGKSLYVEGTGEIFGVGSPQVLSGEGRYGPYSSAVDLTIKATSQITYFENVGGTPIDPYLFKSTPLSKYMGSQIYANVTAQASTATNFCYHMTIVIPTDAKRFRVAIDNANTSSPFRIASGAIATSDGVGADPTFGATTGQARFTPANGTAWTAITWAGASNVEIAAAESATLKRRQWSDWITAPTVENTDGSRLRVVMLRFWVLGTGSSPGNSYSTGVYTQAWRCLAANTALHGGFLWQCIRGTVDGVAVPANFQPTTDLGASPFITSIEYEAYTPGLVINGLCGDSWLAGAVNGSSGNFGNGWIWKTVKNLRERNPGLPIDLVNNGYAGATTTSSYKLALSMMNSSTAIGIPVIMVGSQNDGAPTQALSTAQRARVDSLLSLWPYKEHAILTTYGPNTALAWTATQDAERLRYNVEISALKSSAINVVDMGVVGDGATPERFGTRWTTDNSHPNENGHAIIADNAVTNINAVLNVQTSG